MVDHKTSGQTRSGSGDTKALGQNLPRIRTLLDILYCCPQALLRTFPGLLGNRGDKSCWVKMGRQKCRVQIALHGPDATGTLMPTL